MSRTAHLLNGTAEVWREILTDDGGGGQTRDWAKVGTVRCRFSQPNSTERAAAGQDYAGFTHVVYLAPGADVQRDDELRRAGAPTVRVLALLEPSVPGTYLRADCRATQPFTGGSS